MDVIPQTEMARRKRRARGSSRCSNRPRPTAASNFAAASSTAPTARTICKFTRFLIPPGKRVLELGCGRGDLLAALQPSYGVGIDFSPNTLARARDLHPDLHFVLGDAEYPATLASIAGAFDYVLIADTIGMFEDIDGTLRRVHDLCDPATRIVIS